ncbi:hypothetical protein KM043_010150 [Ampulex compressa]|nr:hypothetical protein KM043_010150 [Ampulex compressa]
MVVSLQTRVFYGLKTEIIGNAHYITDAEVLYPVGTVLAVHNIPQQRQKLIRLPDKYQVNIICVTPNKRYAAVCEAGEKPTISIYDLQTMKRRKSLGIPYDAPGVTKFTCVGFTFDNKYLVAVTGDPDQTMLYYNWEKGKVESSLKVGNPQNPSALIEVLACNPSDAGVVALGGPHIFKFLTVSESVWRPYGFSKADNILVCSMAWLNPDRLLSGTKDGRILYLENGDLKNIYKMSETTVMNLKIREEYVIQTTSSTTTLGKEQYAWENSIRCLVAFQRGFAYAFGVGTIIFFEKDGQHKYTKRNVYVIPPQMAKDDDPDLYQVNTINVNLSYDRLIVTTGWSQLFYIRLWGPDLQMDPEPQKLKVMGHPLHYGTINDLSVCAWKPVFMTCGDIDHSVRLWDFETESLILMKQYTEDICSVALHPTGLFCLIGFSDKLRFMSILIDDLLPMQEFAIRNCRTIMFSHGGHLFAAVNGNIVHVYTTIGFYNHFILKGHTGKVKTLVWSQTDMKLLTLGAEGAIYEWDMNNGQRSGKDDLLLFLACPGGIVISLKCPLQDPVEFVDFHMHSADITKMALTYNEQYLISTAMDGSLCIWKLYYPEGKVAKVGKDVMYTNEVLISKGDLEEKIHAIKDLTARIKELETEHSYKIRQTEVLHNDKLREVHQGYCEAIEELRNKIEKLEEDHKNELNTINVEIVKMKSAHDETIQQMEINYDNKLITEFDKYQNLEERNNTMRQDYERRLKELEEHAEEELKNTIIKYEALVHEKKLKLEEAQDEIAHQVRVHEHLLKQVEDDADQEILQIRSNYETLLYEEKQLSLKLKGEAGVMRNRYMASQKDVDDLKRQVHRAQGEYAQFQKTIQELEKSISDMRKEVNERDVTIQDKERQIYDLKRTNQELEKFKFVLNYKIRELKSQIEPRDQEIKDLNKKIRDMETELVNLHKTNVRLELRLHELQEKLTAARREVQNELQRNKRSEQLIKKIRIDLLDAAGLVQEPHALKVAVTNLYHKYTADAEFLRNRKADLDAQCEFMRQRDHLERTVASLRKQVFHDTSTGGKDVDKMLEENITLITELNALREELKVAQKHVFHMESLLGSMGKNTKPSEAKSKLEKACYGYEELQNEHKMEMQECQRIILALKEDVQRLLHKLFGEETRDGKLSF